MAAAIIPLHGTSLKSQMLHLACYILKHNDNSTLLNVQGKFSSVINLRFYLHSQVSFIGNYNISNQAELFNTTKGNDLVHLTKSIVNSGRVVFTISHRIKCKLHSYCIQPINYPSTNYNHCLPIAFT